MIDVRAETRIIRRRKPGPTSPRQGSILKNALYVSCALHIELDINRPRYLPPELRYFIETADSAIRKRCAITVVTAVDRFCIDAPRPYLPRRTEYLVRRQHNGRLLSLTCATNWLVS